MQRRLSVTASTRCSLVRPCTTAYVSLGGLHSLSFQHSPHAPGELDMHVGPSIPKRASPPLPPATTDTAVITARVHRRGGRTEARGKHRFHPYARPSHGKRPARAAGCSVDPATEVSASAFLGSPVFAPRGNADGSTPVSESDEIEAASEHAAEGGGGGGSGSEIWGRGE